MANKKPIVLSTSGEYEELQVGDVLDAPTAEGEVIGLTNGEASTISLPQSVYLSAADTAKLAKADASTTSKAFGFVASTTIAAAAVGFIQTDGILSGFAALTATSLYFLSDTTAGAITSTRPVGSGKFVVAVGRAINTTTLRIEIETPTKLA